MECHGNQVQVSTYYSHFIEAILVTFGQLFNPRIKRSVLIELNTTKAHMKMVCSVGIPHRRGRHVTWKLLPHKITEVRRITRSDCSEPCQCCCSLSPTATASAKELLRLMKACDSNVLENLHMRIPPVLTVPSDS